MKHLLNILSWVVLFSIIGLMGKGFWDQYRPVTLLEIKTPVEVLTSHVKAGEDLVYKADYCRYANYSARVYRSFVGPTVINTPAVESSTFTGCRTVDVHLNVPDYAEPGTYTMKAVAEFQVTANRLERINYETEPFQVTRP